MFELTERPIISIPRIHEGAGGFVSFEGKVRNHANGRVVLLLEYEAHPELAKQEAEILIGEAKERFGLLDVAIIHRVGRLEIGETAVLIQTASAHRREAFAGCEWIIDQLKFRVPIWKRETYADGDSGWVGADAVMPNRAIEVAYFQRQIRLQDIGTEGQEKLNAARVLLIGVGGLGSGSLPYLVGAGIGTLGLVDFDEVDLSNLHRQVIYQAQDVGRSKAERAAAFAAKLHPGVKIETYPIAITADNVDSLVSAYDWIVDGTDSFSVKFLLNAACRRHKKTLVSASVHKFEGQLVTVSPDGPCLNCLFPEVPSDNCVETCAETGVLGVTPGMLGLLQANEVLKGILGYGDLLTDDLLLMDLRTNETRKLKRQVAIDCPGCQGISPEQTLNFELDSLEEAERELGTFVLIDIRELEEMPHLAIPHTRLPLSMLDMSAIVGKTLIVCAKGNRSGKLVANLRSQGFRDVYSLSSGVQGVKFDS